MGSRIVVDAIAGDWCHILADGPDEDLVAFAERIGLRPERIQQPGTDKAHFDLTTPAYRAAIAAGAEHVTGAELVEIIRRKRAAGVPRG